MKPVAAAARPAVQVDPADVEWRAVRAEGPGGQNVHKVSSAAQLRFDIAASRLPEAVKLRLLARADARLSLDGVLVIKAQDHRSLRRNQEDALARLQALVDAAASPPARRIATRPTAASRRRRVEDKRLRSAVKAARGAGGGEG